MVLTNPIAKAVLGKRHLVNKSRQGQCILVATNKVRSITPHLPAKHSNFVFLPAPQIIALQHVCKVGLSYQTRDLIWDTAGARNYEIAKAGCGRVVETFAVVNTHSPLSGNLQL